MIDNFREKHIFEIFKIFCCKPKQFLFPLLLFVFHILYIGFIVVLIVFSVDLFHLFLVMLILSINVAALFLFRSCPLYLMEEHEVNTNCLRSISLLFFKKTKTKTKTKRQPKILSKNLSFSLHESTTKNIILLYLLTVLKIMFLCIMKTFYV